MKPVSAKGRCLNDLPGGRTSGAVLMERFNKCPKCESCFYQVEKMQVPPTKDIYVKATLKCGKCKNVWEGYEPSLMKW